MRKCEVYLHGIKAGELTEIDSHNYVFAYDRAYLSDKSNPSVCLAMPLRDEPYRSDRLFPFFFNMLSEARCRPGYTIFLRKMILEFYLLLPEQTQSEQ